MLKSFIKFIQSYASQTEQKNKDVLIYMSIVSLPGFIFILLTGKACAIKFVYSVFNWISQNKNLFQNGRLKQVLM